MTENARFLAGTFEHDGVIYPKDFNRSVIERPEIVNCREDDVFVASYPKAGTTWMIEIVSLIMNEGNTEINSSTPQLVRTPMIESNLELPFRLRWTIHLLKFLEPILPKFIIQSRSIKMLLLLEKTGLEAAIGLKQMEKIPSPRLLKCHLPYQVFPSQAIEKKCKIVYVARNPKDTGVSYFHHCSLGFPPMDYKGSWNDFYQLYVNDKVWYGSWFDHVLTWWQHRDDENILFLKYEDMKKDPKGTVKSIAVFLDISLRDDTIDNIVEFCSFKKMRKSETVNISLVVGEKNKHQFIRKGVVGDWTNFFTVAQNKEYEKIYEERMKGSGLDFEW
ncbi:sulfotransferase 1B1-like isoform X3 [Ptychodera flava]|uniref:sulfotransferase 1B1-like isoform X3 n=1 Tax=Ptychodera flava TaxID=63121 RepID=UPI003969BC7C